MDARMKIGFLPFPLNCPAKPTGKRFHSQCWQTMLPRKAENTRATFTSSVLRILTSVSARKYSLPNFSIKFFHNLFKDKSHLKFAGTRRVRLQPLHTITCGALQWFLGVHEWLLFWCVRTLHKHPFSVQRGLNLFVHRVRRVRTTLELMITLLWWRTKVVSVQALQGLSEVLRNVQNFPFTKAWPTCTYARTCSEG